MNIVTYDTDQVSASAPIYGKKCNGIIFTNSGDVDATVEGIPLPAGETMTHFANNQTGDVIVQQFNLRFATGGQGTNKLVSVIRINKSVISKDEECKYTKG